ncbi:MAG: asparagine synthase-related protein, partial [Gammaproteobacteria bacterium]
MFVYQRAALQGPADKTPSDNTPSDLGREARLRHALAAFDTLRSSSEERGGSLLMQGALASSEPTIHQCPGTGRRILCWLGLTRPNELAHRLSVSASTPGPRLVLAAFEKWGEACPRYLRGEYSFVITGANGDMLLAARDAIGTRPLYYRDGAEGFLISAMAAVFPALIRSLEPDPWWLSCKLLRRSGDPRRTAWTDVFKVPPGHALTLRDGRAHVWRWHRFGENGSEHDAVQDEPPRTAADWVVRYGDALETAVTTRVDLAESLGCEASGGIDSSAVLAMAVPYARQRGIPVQGFASLLQDGEEHRVLVCSAHLRMEQTHVFVPQGQIYAPSEQLLHEIRVCGYPLEHRWPVGARSFLALARRLDVDTLLSGFGGDEIVSNHARKVPRELWSQR